MAVFTAGVVVDHQTKFRVGDFNPDAALPRRSRSHKSGDFACSHKDILDLRVGGILLFREGELPAQPGNESGAAGRSNGQAYAAYYLCYPLGEQAVPKPCRPGW